jgi:hypothetical protein
MGKPTKKDEKTDDPVTPASKTSYTKVVSGVGKAEKTAKSPDAKPSVSAGDKAPSGSSSPTWSDTSFVVQKNKKIRKELTKKYKERYGRHLTQFEMSEIEKIEAINNERRHAEYVKKGKDFHDRIKANPKAQSKNPPLLRVVPTTGELKKGAVDDEESVVEEGEVKDKEDETSLSATESDSGADAGESLANLNENGEEDDSPVLSLKQPEVLNQLLESMSRNTAQG